MNTNSKVSQIRIARAKRNLLGKVLCRLAGEETGAVMMEYVIVAVMIAAAVAMGAYFFGKDILNMFGVAGAATTGDNTAAETQVGAARGSAAAGHNEATTRNKAFVESGNKNTGDINATATGSNGGN